MDKLVKQLLELMKLEYGKREFNNKVFDIVELESEVLRKSKVMLEEKNIKVEFENRNVEKYAEAMRTLAQNKELSSKYGKAGKERVENNFLSTQFCTNINTVIDSL